MMPSICSLDMQNGLNFQQVLQKVKEARKGRGGKKNIVLEIPYFISEFSDFLKRLS